MSIRLLRTFVAISETGSFAAAAKRTFVTQAAVSQQIKRLEEAIDTPLFIRGKRSPAMTQAGLALVPQAREILLRYDQFIASARSKSLVAGEIRIGAVPSVMSSLVPLALKKIRDEFPGIHIRIVPNLSADLLTQVHRGEVDAAIMSAPAKRQAGLRWSPLADETMMLVTSVDEAETDVNRLLTTRPYLRMSRQAWISELADELLEERGLSLRDSMELESLETIFGLVSHGLGIAIVPQPCFQDDHAKRLRFHELDEQKKHRTIGVLSKSDNASYQLIHELENSLRDILTSKS